MRWTFVIPVSTCPSRSVARNDNSFVPRVLKGHGFSRAVTCARRVGLQPLGKLALRLNTEVPHWLEHFHTWCIGWSTASAVQLGFGNETALATEVTETLPQALKRDPRIDGSYARLKACSTHRLYTRCETAIKYHDVLTKANESYIGLPVG